MYMSDYTDLLEDQDDDDQGMTAVRKALRAADKRAKDAEKRAEDLTAQARVSSIKDLVKKAGLKEAVARYVPKDIEDADSLETWLKSDEGSVFADSKVAGGPPVEGDPEPVDPAFAVFARLAAAEAGSDQRQTIDSGKVSQTLSGLQGQNLSDRDLLAAFAALDQGKLPG